MKKFLFLSTLFVAGLSLTSCDKTTEEPQKPEVPTEANLDYSEENAKNWGLYATQVARLLKEDAATLLSAWNTSFENGEPFIATFTKHNSKAYPSAKSAVEQIISGCANIANEVGESKIGDPIEKYEKGETVKALYAVESWYSWHSRDDYKNNIYSIRNSLYATLDGTFKPFDENPSILGYVEKEGKKELAQKIKEAIQKAADAITAIPQPFRNHINSKEAKDAQQACGELKEVLEQELTAFLTKKDETGNDDLTKKQFEESLDKIVTNYAKAVIIPTYEKLAEKTNTLYQSVLVLSKNPSNEAFKKACEAWLAAREPWETSEAFLFGPVDNLGLDPNMDSWPLDQLAIVNILKTANFDTLNWADGDSDEKIETAQNVRGFHTLEFLLFKDGKPRTVNNK